MRDLGGNLDIQLGSSRGIVNDSGLALDVNNLLLYNSTYDPSYNIIISGSGAIGNRRVSLTWLQSKIELNADRITGGKFVNGRMPDNIAVTSVTATDVINAATSLSSSLVKSKRFNMTSRS